MKLKKIAALLAALALTMTLTACNEDAAARKYKKLYSQKKYSEALEGFLEIDAENLKNFKQEEYFYIIGNCYLQLGDYEKAAAYLQKCTQLVPEYFRAWVNMGAAYKRLGDSEKAYECYDEALKYDTQDYAPFYLSLGASYIERGKPVSAVEYLERAQALDPQKPDIYAFLAIAYAMEIEPEKSDEAYKTAEALGYGQMDKIREQLDKIS